MSCRTQGRISVRPSGEGALYGETGPGLGVGGVAGGLEQGAWALGRVSKGLGAGAWRGLRGWGLGGGLDPQGMSGRTFARSDGRSLVRSFGRTEILPCVLQDIVPFGAAAQKVSFL